MALEHGIDLVIELPVIAATSSAETFAQGGVRIFSCFFYMKCMSVVKRIIFCDNSCDIHCI